MCREAVLNIVRDASQFYYVFGTRHLMVSARSCRPSRCQSIINLAMKMPNILKDVLQAAGYTLAAVRMSTAYDEPRITHRPQIFSSTWPPHVPRIKRLSRINTFQA